MAKESGVRLSPERRKIKILKVAQKVLSEEGHENFLPSNVAKRCGVSEGTIYRYFPTKHELLQQVAENWLEDLLAVKVESQELDDTLSRLYHAIWHTLKIVCSEPALTRYVFLSQRSDPDYRNTRLYTLVKRFTSKIISIVEDGISKGILRSDTPVPLVKDIILGAIEHQTWTYLNSEREFSVEETASYISDFVFRGMSLATPPNIELIEQSEARLKKTVITLNEEVNLLLKAIN